MKKQQNAEQQWLSLDALCTKLRLPKGCVMRLANQGCLAVVWGPVKNRYLNARFLDPTPEYSEQIRIAQMIHSKLHPIPPDISEFGLLTAREVAQILDWPLKRTRVYLFRDNVPHIKGGLRTFLYSSAAVRDWLWKKDRSTAHARSPFLLTEMIEFFQRWYADEVKGAPTDKQFAVDDEIQRRLSKLVQRAEKDQSKAKVDFATKVELARKIVQILQESKVISTPNL